MQTMITQSNNNILLNEDDDEDLRIFTDDDRPTSMFGNRQLDLLY